MKVGNCGRYWKKEKPEKIWRGHCLKCEKGFWANGKYNRICPECKWEMRTKFTSNEFHGNMAAAVYVIDLGVE